MKKDKKIRVDLRCPLSWGELTAEQTVFVAKLLSERVDNCEELALRCCFKFTGLFPYRFNKYQIKNYDKFGVSMPKLYRYKRHIIEIDNSTIFAFAEKLKFMADTPGLMACQTNISGLYFNDSQLWQTTFEEYCMADRYYRAYSKTHNDKLLCAMIAVLYRKQGEPYRDELVEKNTNRIRRGSKPAQRQAVYLWWTGVKLWLKDKYADLFDDGKNVIEFGNVEDTDDTESIMNMLYSITEGRAHENKEVYKTSVHEVLHALNTKAKSINEMNAKIKKKLT
jgi:hypothetical protein